MSTCKARRAYNKHCKRHNRPRGCVLLKKKLPKQAIYLYLFSLVLLHQDKALENSWTWQSRPCRACKVIRCKLGIYDIMQLIIHHMHLTIPKLETSTCWVFYDKDLWSYLYKASTSLLDNWVFLNIKKSLSLHPLQSAPFSFRLWFYESLQERKNPDNP